MVQLLETKEITINNLSEFIDEINNLDNNLYYFRGENQKFPSISASALRRVGDSVWDSSYYDYKKMSLDYYKKVANSLSDLERENFIPYAQHHGLPTPLIDITDNPSTALYFATESSRSDEGFVYLFSKNKSIDISDLMNNNWNRDILQDFINEDQEVWNLFLSELGKIKKADNSFFNKMFMDLIFWCSDYIQVKTHSLQNNPSSLEEKIVLWFEDENLNISENELKTIDFDNPHNYWNIEGMEPIVIYLSKIYKDKDHQQLIRKLENKIKTNDITNSFKSQDYTDVIGYLILLKSYLYVLNYHVDAWQIHHLPIFPYLSVSPTILFDRMLVQEGLFLYQLSMYKKEDSYNTQVFLTQKTRPEVILKIKNKKHIAKELNSIGINQSKLFPDPDNIAQHMKKISDYHIKF